MMHAFLFAALMAIPVALLATLVGDLWRGAGRTDLGGFTPALRAHDESLDNCKSLARPPVSSEWRHGRMYTMPPSLRSFFRRSL